MWKRYKLRLVKALIVMLSIILEISKKLFKVGHYSIFVVFNFFQSLLYTGVTMKRKWFCLRIMQIKWGNQVPVCVDDCAYL